MTEILTTHTAYLDGATLTAARSLLDDVFENMSDHDWDHAPVWEGAGRQPWRYLGRLVH